MLEVTYKGKEKVKTMMFHHIDIETDSKAVIITTEAGTTISHQMRGEKSWHTYIYDVPSKTGNIIITNLAGESKVIQTE